VVRFEEVMDISYSRILSSNFSSALSVVKDVIADCESEVHVTDDVFDSLSITDRYLEEAIELFECSGGSEKEYWFAEDAAAATTKEATRRNEKNVKTEKTEKNEKAKRTEKSEKNEKTEKTEKTKEEARRNEKSETTKEATRRDKIIEKTKEATRRNEKTATMKEATRNDKNIKKTKEATRRNEKTATKKDETRRDENTETARNGKAEIRGGENHRGGLLRRESGRTRKE